MRSNAPHTARSPVIWLASAGAALAVYAIFIVANLGQPFAHFWDGYYNALELLTAVIVLLRAWSVPEERTAWLVLAIGVISFTVGDIAWEIELTRTASPAVPSVADLFYIPFYGCAFAAMVLLVRARSDRRERGLWLEGLIAFFTVAAFCAAFLRGPFEQATGGSALTTVTSLAYPAGDTAVVAMVITVMLVVGRKADWTWLGVLTGFVLFGVADSVYAYQGAAGTYVQNTVLDLGWPTAFVLFAVAAWMPVTRLATGRLDNWQNVLIPNIAGAAALGLLTYGVFAPIYWLSGVCASVALAIVIVRMGLMVFERMRSLRKLGVSEERYRALIRSLPDTLITLCDRALRLTFVDGAAVDDSRRMSLSEGSRIVDAFPDEDPRQIEAYYREAFAGVHSAHEFTQPDTGRSWSVELGPYRPTGEAVEGVFTVARDVTRRKRAEEELAHQALHDVLTGLANRALFLDRLEQALKRLARGGGRLAVLFIDLDRFKVLNDSLGHGAGDAVLIEIARRLAGALRPSDTVARLGGDEFAVVCDDVTDVAEASEIAARLCASVTEPIQVAGQEVVLRASIGIVMSDDPAASPATLLRNSDTAMYHAKEHGATWRVFEDGMRMAAVRRLEVENALRGAVTRSELRVVYQPMVRLSNLEVVGCEALLRWQRGPDLVPPDEFIPIAEETGLIILIGEWVLRHVIETAAGWSSALPVHVNISPRQLGDPLLIDKVAELLRESGLDPARLCLEVTESGLVADPRMANARIDALRELGVSLAVDDFGIGFSSLFQLRQLPSVDILKIDRAFVTELGHNERDGAIVASLVALAGALHTQVVAEGIETPLQLGELRAMRCEFGQGYLFGAPRPITDSRDLTKLPQEALEHR